MFNASRTVLAILPSFNFGTNKTDFFTSLWNKPQTRDERVKEYVPEVLDESLEEQRAVLEETTSRDIIVELGNKILQQIDNKSPTPSIAPHLHKLLLEYGAKDLIAQRPLSYLLYPNSSALSGGEQPHELVSGFSDNFRGMIEEVERNGCSAKPRAPAPSIAVAQESREESSVETTENVSPPVRNVEGEAAMPDDSRSTQIDKVTSVDAQTSLSSQKPSGSVIMTSRDAYEPMDLTMFVKVAAGMALANLHCGDLRNALRCVDSGIVHAKDASRLGGLLALKAGILVRQKKLEEALNSAMLAIESSGNVQGYLHGAYALRKLNRVEEAVSLLEKAREAHPMNTLFEKQIEAIQEEQKLALPASSLSAPTNPPASEGELAVK